MLLLSLIYMLSHAHLFHEGTAFLVAVNTEEKDLGRWIDHSHVSMMKDVTHNVIRLAENMTDRLCSPFVPSVEEYPWS